MPIELSTIRLDKWLKIARLYKKRSDATEAVDGGSVKVNGERVKPAKLVKAGDVLTVRVDTKYRTITIKKITDKPMKASLAKELYEEEKPQGVTPEMEEMIRLLEKQERKNRKDQKGKPDKKDRRALRKFKYGE